MKVDCNKFSTKICENKDVKKCVRMGNLRIFVLSQIKFSHTHIYVGSNLCILLNSMEEYTYRWIYVLQMKRLLSSWPLFCEVCHNYEVVMFQPWTGTPSDLGSVSSCYIDIFLVPDPPFSARHSMSARGGLPTHAPYLYSFPTAVSPHRIIGPPGRHLYP